MCYRGLQGEETEQMFTNWIIAASLLKRSLCQDSAVQNQNSAHMKSFYLPSRANQRKLEKHWEIGIDGQSKDRCRENVLCLLKRLSFNILPLLHRMLISGNYIYIIHTLQRKWQTIKVESLRHHLVRCLKPSLRFTK